MQARGNSGECLGGEGQAGGRTKQVNTSNSDLCQYLSPFFPPIPSPSTNVRKMAGVDSKLTPGATDSCPRVREQIYLKKTSMTPTTTPQDVACAWLAGLPLGRTLVRIGLLVAARVRARSKHLLLLVMADCLLRR